MQKLRWVLKWSGGQRLILLPTLCCAWHLGFYSPVLGNHILRFLALDQPLWQVGTCVSVKGLREPKRQKDIIPSPSIFLIYPPPYLSQARHKIFLFCSKNKCSQAFTSTSKYLKGFSSLQTAKSEQSLGWGRASCHKQIGMYRLSSSSPDLFPSHLLLRNRK